MAEKQKIFDGSEVPTKRHRDDLVVCSDGSELSEADVWYDCRNIAHCDKDSAHDADVTIVEGVLMEVDSWVTQYTTEGEDYAEGFLCCIDEDSSGWPQLVEEWVDDGEAIDILESAHDDGDLELPGYDDFEPGPDKYEYETVKEYLLDFGIPSYAKVVAYICERLDSNDCELEYTSSDYACYSDSGCCLFSWQIDEYEEQTDFERHPELQELHDQDRLDDVLDDVNCDAYVYRTQRREKNEETGHYEQVGRETYKCWSDTDNITTYHSPGGQWYYVVPAERMEELYREALIELMGG